MIVRGGFVIGRDGEREMGFIWFEIFGDVFFSG